MIKALLFDLDGTMADTDPIHYQTWKDLLQGYGLDIDPSFYKAKFSGRLNPHIVQDLLPHLTETEVRDLSDRKEAEFRHRAAGLLQPLPGLMDVLTWSDRQGLKRAVVTNAPQANAEFMLQVLHLQEFFPLVVLGETLPQAKPDPMPYQVALERLAVPAVEALVFEDSPSGIRSAIGAGIPTIAIASTHAPEELYALGVKLVVSDFTDPHLLNALWLP